MSSKNLSFSLVESNIEEKKPTDVTYDSLVSMVNEKSSGIDENPWYDDTGEGLSLDDYVASELDYNENYTKTIFSISIIMYSF